MARDKASLDIFWLRDESLEDTDNLPAPGVIAAEIVEDLEAALAEFTELAESLGEGGDSDLGGIRQCSSRELASDVNGLGSGRLGVERTRSFRIPGRSCAHNLVEEAPQLIPLAGRPQLVVLGREVQLGPDARTSSLEPDGRLAIVEVKLRANPEARRAIVSQILSYAAYLHGMTPEVVERTVSEGTYCSRYGASATR